MKQNEFIKQYQSEHPNASVEEVLKAWSSASTAHARAHRPPLQKCKPGTIIHFCSEQGITKQAYFKNKKKYLPLYIEYLKNHTKG